MMSGWGECGMLIGEGNGERAEEGFIRTVFYRYIRPVAMIELKIFYFF